MLNPENLPEFESVDALVDAVAKAPEGLFALRLAYDEALRSGGAKDLAAVPELARVGALEIVNSLDPKALKTILKSKHLTAVRSLSLASNYVHDTGTKALASWEPLARVTHLVISGIGLASSGFKALMGSAHLDALEHLDVRNNNLSAASLKLLAGSPLAERLKFWCVDFNEFGDSGVKAIAGSLLMKTSAVLHLQGVTMKKGGLAALLASPDASSLHELSVAGNHGIGDAGLKLFGKDKGLTELRVLDLAGTGMSDASAEVLANAAHLSSLEVLIVNASGGLTSAGLERLLESSHVGEAARRGQAELEKRAAASK